MELKPYSWPQSDGAGRLGKAQFGLLLKPAPFALAQQARSIDVNFAVQSKAYVKALKENLTGQVKSTLQLVSDFRDLPAYLQRSKEEQAVWRQKDQAGDFGRNVEMAGRIIAIASMLASHPSQFIVLARGIYRQAKSYLQNHPGEALGHA